MLLTKTCNCETSLYLFLHRQMQLSTSLIKNLKWKDALLVNGCPEHVDYRLHAGDVVTVRIEETADGFDAEELPLSILYEDEYLIAVDKPAGILVHPSPCRNSGTLANGLKYYYQQSARRCGIHPVSRLDRDTFGVVVFAKSAHIHALFCAMHRAGSIEKNYEAAVFSRPEAPQGEIELPVFKIGGGCLLRIVDERGQYAKSEYKVLETTQNCSKLLLHPVTGRTHQLRLHCLASGFPILGDPQYCTEASKAYSDARGLTYQQLCAVSYRFCHPISGEEITVSSKQAVFLPKD